MTRHLHRLLRTAAAALLASAALHGANRFSAGTTGPEITRLKRLHPETPLARDGRPAAFIAWGAGAALEHEGRALAAALAKLTGATFQAVPVDSLVSEWWDIDFARIGGRHVIAVGNINNNRLLATLWGAGYTAEDSMFPGTGGYVVRTAHDPYGKAFNVVVLAGSDAAGVRDAAAAFLARHVTRRGGETLVAQPVVEVKRGATPSPYVTRDGSAVRRGAKAARRAPPGAAELEASLERLVAQDRSRTDNPALRGVRTLVNVTGAIAALADAYFETGDLGIPPLMKRVLDQHRALLQVKPRRVEMEGASADHLNAWDRVEELPIWTDQDRLDLTNAFLRDARQGFEHRASYELVKEGYTQIIDENHGTNSALHLLRAWGYFEKHYDLPDTAYWMSIVRATFAGQLASHNLLEDAANYLTIAPGHNATYAFLTRDMRYFQLGIAQRQLDFMLQACLNNLGLVTGFGDTPNITTYGHRTMARLAWMLRDPRAAWLIRDHFPNTCGIEFYEPELPWDLELEPRAPVEWNGEAVLPIYRQALGLETKSKTLVTTPPEPAGDEWFNKIVFRESAGADGQYLLLDGAGTWKSARGLGAIYPPGPSGHKHDDINTIINFVDAGRMWLVDHTYEERDIGEHSGVVIARDGLMNYEPHPAKLLDRGEGARVALTRTVFEEYSGADWERSIFWHRGDYFVVLDRVIAREPGEFAVRAKFRGLGEHTLGRDGLWLEQHGKWCRIAPADAAEATVSAFRFPAADAWKAYRFAEPVAKDYEQFKARRLARGEAIRFANVLAAGESRAELAALRIAPWGERGVVVTGAGGPAVYGVGAPGEWADGTAFALAMDEVVLAGVTRIGSPDAPVLRASKPLDVTWSAAGVRLSAREAATVELPREGGRKLVLRGGTVAADAGEAEARSVADFLAGVVPATIAEAQRSGRAGAATAPRETGEAPALAPVARRQVGAGAERMVFADLDGDGARECLVAGRKGLAVYRANGDVAWTFETPRRCRALDAGDVDGDGRLEVVLGCDDEHAYLLGHDGRERWRFKCSASDLTLPPAVDAVRAVDLDGDRRAEVLVAGNWLHCLGADGKPRWEDYLVFHRNRYRGDINTLAVDDYDADGRPEIVATFLFNYHVTVGYDAAGKRIFPRDPQKVKHGGATISRPQAAAVIDVFGDGGAKEIVVGTKSYLTLFRTDGPNEGVRAFEQPGSFAAIAWTAGRPGAAPLIFASSDLGAVFAFQAAGESGPARPPMTRRWVRPLGRRVQALWAGGAERAVLVAGAVDGSVLKIDPESGAILACTPACGSPVVQLIEDGGRLHALHGDGIIESFDLND